MLPRVSIIIPCRNEEAHILSCLDSICCNGYPKDLLEILVVDGLSQDATSNILTQYQKSHDGGRITILTNPKRIQSAALNIGIRASRGDILMRMDAHCTYSDNYISKCVDALMHNDAASVGGKWIIKPRNNGRFAKSVALALSNSIGVGKSRYRTSSEDSATIEVETVPFFCMKKEWVDKVGFFNEEVGPSEDVEYNRRIKDCGGKILLLPHIYSVYFARSDIRSFAKHNFRNGMWAVLPFLYSRTPGIRLKHLIPLCMVLFFIFNLFSCLSGQIPWSTVIVSFFCYILLLVSSSISIAITSGDFALTPFLIVAFLVLHWSYGLGSLVGCFQGVIIFFKKVMCPVS